MRRSQGRPLSTYEVRRIVHLLKNTDLPMPTIATSVGCSRSAVFSMNRKHGVREYGKSRSKWVLGETRIQVNVVPVSA